MEQPKQITRQIYHTVQSVLRHGSFKKLRLIVVFNNTNAPAVAGYINEILKEANFKTAMIVNSGQEDYFARLKNFLRQAKRGAVDYAIIEATNEILKRRVIGGIPIEALVVTELPSQSDGSADLLYAMQPRFVIVNHDIEPFDNLQQLQAEAQKMTYGKHPESEARIAKIKLYRKGTEVNMTIDHQTHLELATNLLGGQNTTNVAAAVTVAYLLGIKLGDIQEGIANLEMISGRLERVVDGFEFDVLVDKVYDEAQLTTVLDVVRPLTRKRLILVIGGFDKNRLLDMVVAATRKVDRIFLTGENIELVYGGLGDMPGVAKITGVADKREAVQRAISSATKGDVVLIVRKNDTVEPSDASLVRELTAQLFTVNTE